LPALWRHVYADLMADPNPLPLNLYQIWLTSRNERGGVWVVRTTWPGVYVRITSVGEYKGAPPYFGYPKVTADLYHADGRLKESGASLPAPGTSETWRQIAVPVWWNAG